MALTPESVAILASQEVNGIFRDAFNTVRDGEANYLRDGEPESVSGKIAQAAGRSACRIYGAGNVDLNPTASARYERACRPYLDSIEPGGGAGLAVPFAGGQCDGQGYLLVASFRNTTTDARQQFTRTAYGPIGGVRYRDAGSNQGILEVFCRGLASSTSCSNLPGSVQPLSWRQVATSTVSGRDSPRIDSVSPCGLDNCGNPPPEIRPPSPITDPQPPPFRFSPSADIDVFVGVAIVNIDGTLELDIGTGPITINPTLEIDVGGGGGGDGGGGDPTDPGDPGDPTDPGSPGTPRSTGDGGEAEDEAPDGEELVGLLVEVLEAPPKAGRLQRNIREPYRGVGYVRMGFPGRLGNDVSGAAVISPQFFHAQQRGLTAWEVSANLGFSLRVTPFYRKVS